MSRRSPPASSIRQGTLPDGEYWRISSCVLLRSRRIAISANGSPACLAVSQGRSDHEEKLRLPMTSVSMAMSPRAFAQRPAR
jgi:hypothetical protein